MNEPTYEELERELDGIVARLERGELPLDEAIAFWQRGEELHRLCRQRLQEVELRVEELTAGDAPPAEPPSTG